MKTTMFGNHSSRLLKYPARNPCKIFWEHKSHILSILFSESKQISIDRLRLQTFVSNRGLLWWIQDFSSRSCQKLEPGPSDSNFQARLDCIPNCIELSPFTIPNRNHYLQEPKLTYQTPNPNKSKSNQIFSESNLTSNTSQTQPTNQIIIT